MTLQSGNSVASKAQYRVILSGKVMPECDHQQVIEGLASLFHSQARTMENLLKGHPMPLKKQYDKEQAQIICTNIREIGAQCTIEEISEIQTKEEVKEEVNDKTSSDSEVRNETNSNKASVTESTTESSTSTESSTGGADSSGQPNKEKRQTLLMRFVNHNTDYYQHQFRKFSIADESSPNKEIPKEIPWSAFKITWHWSAFFYFFFWALYRKMWGWAMLHVLGGVGLMLWVDSFVVSLIWVFIWPLVTNFLYFRIAVATTNRAMENPQTAPHYLAKGGVSKGAVWGGILIILISGMLVSNYVTTRFLNEYGEQISAVLPGSGTQIRGTGLSLEGVVGGSKLAHTSLVLSALATSLKVLLLKNNAQDDEKDNEQYESPPMQSVITTFINHLNSGEVSDGWGGKIRVEQHVNRYVLISAGPDQVFKTDDDVIQPVMIY